jgi:hypothetical protein
MCGVSGTCLDHVRAEGRVLLLEHHGHDVVADVAFSLQLLRVPHRVGQQRGNVEHQLLLLELRVHTLQAKSLNKYVHIMELLPTSLPVCP